MSLFLNYYSFMDMKKVISDNLKSLHKRYEMNQTSFADYCGLHQRTYNRIINMESLAKIDLLERIASKCGLEVWQLLTPKFKADNPPMLESDSIRQQQWYDNMKKAAQELVEYDKEESGNK